MIMAYNLLKGKRGLIFGALNEASIAWKVAERTYEEGANLILTNTPIACRMGNINDLALKTHSTVIPADATSIDDLERLFTEAQEKMQSTNKNANTTFEKFLTFFIISPPLFLFIIYYY